MSEQQPSQEEEDNKAQPVVYGEIVILGYNGHLPQSDKSRRTKSKFTLYKRQTPNGIKKSKHYIVKQPQATKAIQDKALHSISYTISRSQAIIVEYQSDQETDMFQIGRSSESPIDFVVIDTLANNNSNSNNNSNPTYTATNTGGAAASSSGHQSHHHHTANNNNNPLNTSAGPAALLATNYPYQQQQLLLQHPLPSHQHHHHQNHNHHHHHHHHHHQQQPQAHKINLTTNDHHSHQINNGNNYGDHLHQLRSRHQHYSSTSSSNNNQQQQHHQHHSSSSSSPAQSTISRFACRILVDRKPPYTARIYAAGFDSSRNIFLGEKATKWEQNNEIDGLTTNGILIMHPKRGFFAESTTPHPTVATTIDSHGGPFEMCPATTNNKDPNSGNNNNDINITNNYHQNSNLDGSSQMDDNTSGNNNSNNNNNETTKPINLATMPPNANADFAQENNSNPHDTNNNSKTHDNDQHDKHDTTTNTKSITLNNQNAQSGQPTVTTGGGVWREVSVDGGVYAIRESRSAAQKGTKVDDETNILQDGTLIDLCGATLLWRSMEGLSRSPTKRMLEKMVDRLNAARPQCPVGLNTLVIPKKPVTSNGHREPYPSRDLGTNHQPYVYIKCGHVQGSHDWGATKQPNQRTCPICFSVGHVARLAMGIEPSFYVDCCPPTHVFNPCGHMANEKTIEYWSTVKIPHGTHFFHSICPFCATPVATGETKYTKLIFQDYVD